jgi:hypothetical protein
MSVVWPSRSVMIKTDGDNASCIRNSLTEPVWGPQSTCCCSDIIISKSQQTARQRTMQAHKMHT